MAGARLSRRDLLGGLVSAAAVGVATPAGASALPTLASALDDVVARSGNVIRLGANENPTGPGPAARAAFAAALGEANRYPGRVHQTLLEALTGRHQVSSSSIYLTPGSGELLRSAALAFTGPSRALVTAAPTFEAPSRAAYQTGAQVRAVPVTADGRLDLDAMLAKAAGAGLIYVCNPNNPTGGSVAGADLLAFITALEKTAPDAKVLVDEAYFEYADEPGYATAIPTAVANPRVIVTRTFSKVFGMAGLRVGYAVGQSGTLDALERFGGDGLMSNASLATAAAAFTDTDHIAAERARNTAVRRGARERFEAAGYRVLPSAANFLMIDIRRDAGTFGWACRQERIAVSRPFPPLTNYMRITIGTQAEMDEAVPVILGLLKA